MCAVLADGDFVRGIACERRRAVGAYAEASENAATRRLIFRGLEHLCFAPAAGHGRRRG